jgi:hypothetical protein
VLASDLSTLSSFLQQNFNYSTGAFDNIPKEMPAKPWMIRTNANINNANKLSLRYNQLDSSSDIYQSSSSSLGVNRQTNTTNFLTSANSNYSILENIKSGIGELDSVFHGIANTLRGGFTRGVSKSVVEPGSTASSSWGSGNPFPVIRTMRRLPTRRIRPASACSCRPPTSRRPPVRRHNDLPVL